jgi:predicted RecA/RadA family phage recombinase
VKNFVQPGDVITAPAPAGGVSSGDGVLVANVFGIAAYDAAAGQPVEVSVTGCYRLPKAAGALAFGVRAYWNGTTVTGTASGNTKIGLVSQAAAADDATVVVRLDGVAV